MRGTVVAVCLLALVGCWSGDETPVSDLGDATPSSTPPLDAIQMLDFLYEVPDPLDAGGEITVANAGDVVHTFTIRGTDVDTGIVQPGGATTVTLPEAGRYEAFCTVHPQQMRTTIEVG